MKAARLALVYAAFGTAWITLSDRLAAWLFPAPSRLAAVQTVKGLIFVAVTTVLVYWLLRRARLDVERSRSWYRGLFETSPDAFFVIAPPGRFLDANTVAVQRYGYSREELLAMGPADLAAPDVRDDVGQRVATAIEGPARFEWRHVTRGGEELSVEIAACPVESEQGTVVLAAVRDVTERKRAEQDRQRLEDQLRQSQKMEAIGQLAGGVAHDFNNMLMAILGYTDMMLADAGPAHPFRERLEEVRRAAGRSADLTRQLLAFARRQTIAPATVDLNEIIAGMLKMVRRLIGEDIDLHWVPGAALWTIKMDPAQVDQVVVNLVVNARHAISGTGRVTIETANTEIDTAYSAAHPESAPGRWVVLAVSDNGAGMDQDTMARIFEPFFTTRPYGQGSGLGLATVYGIVRQNGGFINVYSEPRRGTTFRVYLPRFEETAGTADAREAAGEPELLPTGQARVLLVEDEEALLRLARHQLERLGYTVLSAATPEDALHLARTTPDPIDLLMTDVVLPRMSGRELADRIAVIRPGIRCLYVSGYTADVISHHGVLDEGVHFLQKPFSVETLARKLQEALQGL